MPNETLPLLLVTFVAYVTLGTGTLFRVRSRRRADLAARGIRGLSQPPI
jgi:hypothetical protein